MTKSSDKERKAAKLECRLLSEFRHPNIVQYKTSFEYRGFLYIAMGFCEGGDLYTRLRMRNGILLSERVLVEWFVQLAIALQVFLSPIYRVIPSICMREMYYIGILKLETYFSHGRILSNLETLG